MVKDLRTGYETGNTQAVLDGDLDAFMQAELERLATGGRLAGGRRRGRRGVTAAPGATARAGGADAVTYPARPAATELAGVRRDLARVASTTISAGSPSRRSPTSSPRSCGCTPTSTRPIRRRSSSPRPRSADRPARGETAPIDAFAVVVRRDELWFLSMLFVRPGARRAGSAARSWPRSLPGGRTATRASRATAHRQRPADLERRCTRSLGIVPRMPLLGLVGLPTRPEAFGALPAGVEAIAFDEVADGRPTASVDRRSPPSSTPSIGTLPGFAHPADHALPAREGRIGFLFRDRGRRASATATPARPAGSARSPSAIAGLLGAGRRPSRAGGPAARRVRGVGAGRGRAAIVPLSAPGFRLDGFPVLLCWDRPFADFSRYLPMSPGLL